MKKSQYSGILTMLWVILGMQFEQSLPFWFCMGIAVIVSIRAAIWEHRESK